MRLMANWSHKVSKGAIPPFAPFRRMENPQMKQSTTPEASLPRLRLEFDWGKFVTKHSIGRARNCARIHQYTKETDNVLAGANLVELVSGNRRGAKHVKILSGEYLRYIDYS